VRSGDSEQVQESFADEREDATKNGTKYGKQQNGNKVTEDVAYDTRLEKKGEKEDATKNGTKYGKQQNGNKVAEDVAYATRLEKKGPRRFEHSMTQRIPSPTSVDVPLNSSVIIIDVILNSSAFGFTRNASFQKYLGIGCSDAVPTHFSE
jgi:hypothetical protein